MVQVKTTNIETHKLQIDSTQELGGKHAEQH